MKSYLGLFGKNAVLLAVLLLSFSSCTTPGKTYTPADAHSHNDYKQSIPFYRAYDAGFGSIEADVYAVDGKLMVAHEEKEITPERSLTLLYIDPLTTKLKKDASRKLRLLIEIKKDYVKSLPLAIAELKPLSQYFDYDGHPGRLSVVMTGAVPPGAVMLNYPAWMTFDVDHMKEFTPQQLTKIGLISIPFDKYSEWNGAGDLPGEDERRITGIIDSAHAIGKKIRFFAIPDTSTCWKKLIQLHADIIGTDHINELAGFLNKKAY